MYLSSPTETSARLVKANDEFFHHSPTGLISQPEHCLDHGLPSESGTAVEGGKGNAWAGREALSLTSTGLNDQFSNGLVHTCEELLHKFTVGHFHDGST